MADALSTALTALAGEPSSNSRQSAVYEALLSADVVVPRDAEGRALIDRDERALAIFSAPETAIAWGAADGIHVRALDLFAWARSEGVERVVLDGAGPVVVAFGPDELRVLASGSVPTK